MATVAAFQKNVLTYSHLPASFLRELSAHAKEIPSTKRDEILAELDVSAKRELKILQNGYTAMVQAEKKMRSAKEKNDRKNDIARAEKLLNS